MTKIKAKTFDVVMSAAEQTMADSYEKKIAKKVQSIAVALTKNDFDLARERLDKLTLAGVFWGHRKRMRMIGESAMRFGGSRLADVEDLLMEPTKDKFIGKSMKALKSGIDHTNTHIIKAGMKQIDKLEADKVSTKNEKTREFVSFMNAGAGAAGKNNVKLVSSLHTSRLAQYGYTVEARLRGIDYYSINAVVDGRTSKICLALNGKVFPVEYAVEFTEHLLSLEDPEDIKNAAPWPTGKQNLELLEKMSTAELMEANWACPPFHPYCRTYIDKAGATVEIEIDEILVQAPKAVINEVTTPGGLPVDLVEKLFSPATPVTMAAVAADARLISTLDAEKIAVAITLYPDLTESKIEDILKLLATGAVDDPALMERFNISFEALMFVKGFL
jgi:hypothetical protein